MLDGIKKTLWATVGKLRLPEVKNNRKRHCMPLITNANFDRLVKELTGMGPQAQQSPTQTNAYQEFIKRFPAANLPDLSLDNYCMGKGDGKSFCWWLEHGLKPVLGIYSPGTSRGHLLYFDQDKLVYKNNALQGLNDQDALSYTLKVHAAIANADPTQDLRWVDNDDEIYERAGVDPRVTMGAGRKLRLLAAYHPDAVVPISSTDHLAHFLKALGCPPEQIPTAYAPVARMLMLRDYWEAACQQCPAITTYGFMKALYAPALGLAPQRDVDGKSSTDLDLPTDSAAANTLAPATTTRPMTEPLNQILFGPPGTGKTYATIDAALKILDPVFWAENSADRKALKARFDALTKDQRVRFVTFHQSFSYEDFVEGLRATTDEETQQLRYEVMDGVFKTICNTAKALAAPQKVAAAAGISVKGRRIWKMSLGDTHGSDAVVYDECMAGGYILLGYGEKVDFTGCTTRQAVAAKYQ